MDQRKRHQRDQRDQRNQREQKDKLEAEVDLELDSGDNNAATQRALHSRKVKRCSFK